MIRQLAAVVVGCVTLGGPAGSKGDEVFFENQGGQTYRVTRRVEKRPVTEMKVDVQKQTVISTEYVTEMREVTRTVWVPITRTTYEPQWEGWWNPFGQPRLAYRPRTVTQWELRTQTIQEPVIHQRQIPMEKLVEIPRRTLGFVEEVREERVAVGPVQPTTPPTMNR